MKCLQNNILPHMPQTTIPLNPNGLRIPKHQTGINHLLQRQQPSIDRLTIILDMRLRRRERRVHIVQICREIRLRLRSRNSIVKAINEWDDSRGKGRRSVTGETIVLEDPEGGAVGVGGKGSVFGVDLRVGAAVDVDDGEPRLLGGCQRRF